MLKWRYIYNIILYGISIEFKLSVCSYTTWLGSVHLVVMVACPQINP